LTTLSVGHDLKDVFRMDRIDLVNLENPANPV
jgi:hypothetical protein